MSYYDDKGLHGSPTIEGNDATFNLVDYLSPGEKRKYNKLGGDLEFARSNGYTVYLRSVPGFLIVAGHPNGSYDGELDDYPWSNCGGGMIYQTAWDAINDNNGKGI